MTPAELRGSVAANVASEEPPAALVDVIMVTWNSQSTVERAISSALFDPAVHRVLVVDNGSEDGTRQRVRASDDGSGRVVLFELETNRGPSAARNVALGHSKAPWVAVLDSDDFVRAGRFTKLLAMSRDWDFVADDVLQIASDRVHQEEPVPLWSAEPFEPWRCSFETFVLGNISIPGQLRKELGFFKPLMRRAFLNQHNLRYDEDIWLGEDYALYARALALGARFLVVPAEGYISVNRPDSLSARHSRTQLERLRDSDRTLAKLRQFSRAETRAIEKHYRSIDARIQWLEVIEAVKERRPVKFAGAFVRSPDVSMFLTARLWEQILLRGSRVLGFSS